MWQVPALLDQINQKGVHLPHKPWTSLAAQERSIEPIVLRDMLEECDPDLGRMLSTKIGDRVHQGAASFGKDPLYQVVLILVVAIEGRAADHRALGELANRERLESPLLDQFNKRLTQQRLRTPHTHIACLLSHFALPVSSETDVRDCTWSWPTRPSTLRNGHTDLHETVCS